MSGPDCRYTAQRFIILKQQAVQAFDVMNTQEILITNKHDFYLN